MVQTLMILQAIASVLLIILVLLQFGKGAEAGLLGAGDSVMSGSQRGNMLSKLTVVLSIFFFSNSVYLAKIQSSKADKSLLDSEAPIAAPFNNDAANAEAEKAQAEQAKVGDAKAVNGNEVKAEAKKEATKKPEAPKK